MPSPSLDAFVALTQSRRATRRFRSDPLPEGVLGQLLEATRWAPSGYNLQPTHIVVVTQPQQRAALARACMDQAQITEAPAALVFLGDRLVAEHHFETVLRQELDAGSMAPEYETALRKFVPLAFGTGPLGLGWLWKATLCPLLQWFTPMPSIPAVHRRYWLAKQVSLAAMTFMLAAEAAGLNTCPMEGFDERRVRRAIAAPRHMLPILVTPLGYTAATDGSRTRLPVERTVHRERW